MQHTLILTLSHYEAQLTAEQKHAEPPLLAANPSGQPHSHHPITRRKTDGKPHLFVCHARRQVLWKRSCTETSSHHDRHACSPQFADYCPCSSGRVGGCPFGSPLGISVEICGRAPAICPLSLSTSHYERK